MVETGICDFRKLTLTIIKSTLPKVEPKIFHYRNYKKFDNQTFRNELLFEICKKGFQNIISAEFEHLFIMILDKYAPMKTKYLRAKNSPFMNKELTKAIMVRSRLKNESLKLKTIEAREAYKKQRNFCVFLLRRIKKNLYENLNPKFITDNKKFWKQVNPFFSDKSPTNGNIMLSEDDDIIRNQTKRSEIFNRYFISAIESLEIDRTLHTTTKVYDNDPVELAIKKYKNHPSIIRIHQEGYSNNNFSFRPISQQDIHVIINNIDSSKAYQKENIPPRNLKDNTDI